MLTGSGSEDYSISVVPAESRRLATVGGLQGLTASKSVRPPKTFGEQCDLWSPRLTAGDYQTVRSPYQGKSPEGVASLSSEAAGLLRVFLQAVVRAASFKKAPAQAR